MNCILWYITVNKDEKKTEPLKRCFVVSNIVFTNIVDTLNGLIWCIGELLF